jgi:alkylhydroperoxidase domain protein
MRRPFTLAQLEWQAWVEPVALEDCTDEQIAVLEASHSGAKQMDYYRTLVHDPRILLQRSLLFNAIMYGRGGLPRPDRELSAVAESRVNGCVFCASVHARLFVQLTKEEAAMQRLLDEGVGAPLDARRRAIVDYAVKLAATPPTAGPEDIAAMREVGLSDAEIQDVTNVVAMFAWANQLMLTLGAPKDPG